MFTLTITYPINGILVPVDYTRYIEAGTFQIVDQINVPTTATFNLANIDAQFTLPPVGAYVKLQSSQYNIPLFTGWITSVPGTTLLGASTASQGPMWQYTVRVTSDEYLLNNKVTPFLPAFVNTTQGQVIATLTNALAPGMFDVTSHVASGDIVPYYQYDPSQSWSDIVKQFADGSRYRYRVIDKVVYYQPYGDAPLGISYDETAGQSTFDPNGLQLDVVDKPLINDAIVIGDPEGGSYVQSYFLGDGYTSNFQLPFEGFRLETNALLTEAWNEATIDTSTWVVYDPEQDFQPYQGSLNIVGGEGIGVTYIVGNNGLELGGTLYVQVGDFTITGQSSGLVGCLSTESIPTLASTFAGFQFAAVGSTGTMLTIVLNGASGVQSQAPTWPAAKWWGPRRWWPAAAFPDQYPTVINVEPTYHTYQLLMTIKADQSVRYTRAFRTLSGQSFGELEQPSGAWVRWQVFDTDMTTSIQEAEAASATVGPIVLPPPNLVLDVSAYVPDIPAFAVYAPFNSENLQMAVGNTLIAQPPEASLFATPNASGDISPGSIAWQPLTLGFGLLGRQDATIGQGQNGNSLLQFYSDDIPPEQTLIQLRYREAQKAMARVQDSVSIAAQAKLAGDDGHRGTIQLNLNPQPRSSEEASAAAAALITDAENPQFQGTYNANYYFWNAQRGYPVTGRYLYLNAPERNANAENLLVQSVTTTVVELRREILTFAVGFGQDMLLQKLLTPLVYLPNQILPQDTTQSPLPQQVADIQSSFLADLDNVTLVAISSTGAVIDVGVDPATGIEIRLQDYGWGGNQPVGTAGVLGRWSTRQITVQRNNPVSQLFYIRQVNGTTTSRRTSIVHFEVPTLPLPISGYDLDTSNVQNPILTVALPLDVLNIQGVEVRAADNVTVLAHVDYLTQQNLIFSLGPMSGRSVSYWVYTYNLLGGYSSGVEVTGSVTPPGVENLTVDETTECLEWVATGNSTQFVIEIQRGAGQPIVSVTVAGVTGSPTTPMSHALGMDDLLQQRTFTVTAFDFFGAGGDETITHLHIPLPVASFNDPDQIFSLPPPTNATTSPTVPASFSNNQDEIVSKSWETYRKIPRIPL